MNLKNSKNPPSIEPLENLGDDQLNLLREKLARAGYHQNLIAQTEAIAQGQLDAIRLPLVHWKLQKDNNAASNLALLFAYAARVARSLVENALSTSLTNSLIEAGLLREAGQQELEASFRITPLEGLFIICDPHDAGEAAAVGPGMTTLTLVQLLPQSPTTVLDIGCGAGSLALLAAARGATRSVGVDLNPRAVALSQINGRLNNLKAQFYAGDLLEPIKGQQFDLVLSQPPYVVQPPGVAATTYLHGGPRGDELALRFAAAIPQSLNKDGRAFLLFDSPPGKESLTSRLRQAINSTSFDLMAFLAPGPSVELQAVAYGSLEDRELGQAYDLAVRHYRDHLENLGAKSFSRCLALIINSSRSGPGLTMQLPVAGLGQLTASALENILSSTMLARAREENLLQAKVSIAPGAKIVEERQAGELQQEPLRAIRFEKGAVAMDKEISEAGLVLFMALEESENVASAVQIFAQACGKTPDSVRRTVIDFVREGLARSLLVRAP